MYCRNRVASLVFKSGIVVLAAVGVYLNSGLPDGRFAPSMFLYYTILSNCLCLLYFLAAAVATGRAIKKDGIYGEATWAIHLKGAVIIAITVTFLIYWFVLVGAGFAMALVTSSWANLIVHLIVPVLSIADWAVFDPKGQFSKADPFKWLLIPLCYFIFAVVAAGLGATYYGGGRYPYFFIDADALGWPRVLGNVLGLAVAFLVLGFFLYAVDKVLCRWGKARGGGK